ncbi:hypothetical protein G210_2820, partial [Candida maltosa Xu316]
MNTIKQINQINQKELNSNTSYTASWHYEYRDTNYLYLGNIPFNIVEKDIIIIFSQYGIPTHINMVKDKETGKHRGFGFLKYANFKSCILAIDNFNGIKLGDRVLRVDHTYYKLRGDEREDDYLINYDEVRKEIEGNEEEVPKEPRRITEKKEVDEDRLLTGPTNDEDEFKDPMETVKQQEDDDDDEFKDPMEQFIKDKHRKHKSHRHRSDRHRTKDREKSPSR